MQLMWIFECVSFVSSTYINKYLQFPKEFAKSVINDDKHNFTPTKIVPSLMFTRCMKWEIGIYLWTRDDKYELTTHTPFSHPK